MSATKLKLFCDTQSHCYLVLISFNSVHFCSVQIFCSYAITVTVWRSWILAMQPN